MEVYIQTIMLNGSSYGAMNLYAFYNQQERSFLILKNEYLMEKVIHMLSNFLGNAKTRMVVD